MYKYLYYLLQHRMIVGILTVCLVVLGVFSWRRLPVDAFPDVTNQQVMIFSEAEGLSPVDVEQQITFPIEWVMGGLPGVEMVRSLSKTGLSLVVIVFKDKIDTYFARQLVLERLQKAKEQLPEGVEPEMGPISTGLGEVFQYNIKSDRHSLTELRTMQDWMVAPRLRMIEGVNEVNSFGGLVRRIHVIVNPDRLLKYKLTLTDITRALAENNSNAGGSFIVKSWEQENIRSVGLFGSVRDIEDVVLKADEGKPVFLKEVAEVKEGAMTRMGAVSRDGSGEVVAGMVIMLKGENSKRVVERVKAAIPDIERSLPEGAVIDVFYDRTHLVDAVIDTISDALLQGGIFVIIILFLLIGSFRPAVAVMMSLPLAALFAFILMDVWQVTANLMSLGGLAIAVGMVVDGSIVVTENIVRHLREHPTKDRIRVITRATVEVARPITFSILIIVLVFVPLFTLEGMEGRMFKPLALTMVFAMLGSLVVAMLIMPVFLSFILKNKTKRKKISAGKKAHKESRVLFWLQKGYLRALEKTLVYRRITVVLAALMFLGTMAAISLLGTEFLPDLDEGAIAINVVRLPNASLEGSIQTGNYMEKELLKFPEVKTVVTKTGRAEISEDPMGPEQSDLIVMLHPESKWKTGRNKKELVALMQKRLSKIPGLRMSFSQPIALRVNELISGVKSDLAIKIFGQDIEVLKTSAHEIAAALRSVKGAEDVLVEPLTGFMQLDVIPDRRAMARYKLNMSDINNVIETAVGGKVATVMIDGQTRVGVQVRYPEKARNDIQSIKSILLPTPSGARVPLGDVARVNRLEGPAQISRENNMRRVVVEANVRGRDLGGFVKEAQKRLSKITSSLPPGYWVEYGGTFENQQRAMRRLGVVVPLSVFLIFLMLISAMGSIKDAGLVFVVLPFSLVGGVLSMLIFDITLNVPSVVGFIALFGVAVQDGTVLVTFTDQLRKKGKPLREALTEACKLRFRALIMTSATTMLGLLPLVYVLGPGSEIQRPLAVVVIGGLLSATTLTLFVLPSLYYWSHGSKVRTEKE